MESEPGSTVPRRQLGRYLRQLRDESGHTIKVTADHIECSIQKIWRIEKGDVPVRGSDVLMLCRFFGATEEMTEALMALARETKAKGWWHSYADVLPFWFFLYVGLEAAANRIRKFEAAVFDGLLQAPAYMEALLAVAHPEHSDEERQKLIAAKAERRHLLTRHFPPPPQLEVIIWEPVLRSPVDVPGALEQQLFHLLEAGALPNVSIRVLPLVVGPHRASVTGAFVILEFPEGKGADAEPPVVYLESLTGGLYLDKPREFKAYDEMWHGIADLALSEEDSKELIIAIMKEMNANGGPDRR